MAEKMRLWLDEKGKDYYSFYGFRFVQGVTEYPYTDEVCAGCEETIKAGMVYRRTSGSVVYCQNCVKIAVGMKDKKVEKLAPRDPESGRFEELRLFDSTEVIRAMADMGMDELFIKGLLKEHPDMIQIVMENAGSTILEHIKLRPILTKAIRQYLEPE